MSALTIQKTTYKVLNTMDELAGDPWKCKPTYHIVVKNHKQLPQKGEWSGEVDIGPFGSEEAAQNFMKKEAKEIKLTTTFEA